MPGQVESANRVTWGRKLIPEGEAANRIFAPKVREALAGASDLIAVGLASKDGIRAEEEARALARSKTVAGWITKVAKPETELWALTLGQYGKACKLQEDKDLSFERPVLFVGVRSKAGRRKSAGGPSRQRLAGTIICRAAIAIPASTLKKSARPE